MTTVRDKAGGLRMRTERSVMIAYCTPGTPGTPVAPGDRTNPESHVAICLHPAPRRQDRAAEAPDPEEHLAQLFPRREDRRARPERFGQVHAAQDHGRRGHELRRRGEAAAEHEHR